MSIQTFSALPSPDILTSIRNDSALNLWKALAEIVDNSFDKFANRVTITHKDDAIVVEDDGSGCEDIKAMVALGSCFRDAKKGNTIGRYGVGLKEASVWLCERMHILTNTGNICWDCLVDWNCMIAKQDWNFQANKIIPPSEKIGTVITFKEIILDRSKRLEWAGNRLAAIFTPGLLNGKQILVNGNPLRPVNPPQLVNAMVVCSEYQGKKYDLIAGMIPPTQAATDSGWTICYGHRVIASQITEGSDGYSMARFYGRITLTDEGAKPWTLNKFKDGIEELTDFLESLLPRIEPILKQSTEQARVFELEALTKEAQNILDAMICGKKTNRRPSDTDKDGTIEPRNTNRKHKPNESATENNAGLDAKTNRKVSKVNLLWDCSHEGHIGCATSTKTTTFVHLNPNHEYMSHIKDAPKAVAILAMSLTAAHVVLDHSPQKKFAFALDIDDSQQSKFERNLAAWAKQIASKEKP